MGDRKTVYRLKAGKELLSTEARLSKSKFVSMWDMRTNPRTRRREETIRKKLQDIIEDFGKAIETDLNIAFVVAVLAVLWREFYKYLA